MIDEPLMRRYRIRDGKTVELVSGGHMRNMSVFGIDVPGGAQSLELEPGLDDDQSRWHHRI